MILLRIVTIFALIFSVWFICNDDLAFGGFMAFLAVMTAINAAILGGALRRLDL
jgi:hypothetical protein